MLEGSTPRVTVCITTYNHAAYIRQCVASVLGQARCSDIEILVGDDGSRDGTRDVLLELAAADRRITLVFNPVQLGPSANLSNLVAQASGNLIAHLDGDDYWLPHKLSTQIERLDRRPSSVAAYSNAYVVSAADRRIGIFNCRGSRTIEAGELLVNGNFLCHSTLLYRREAIEAVAGMQPPYIDYRIHLRLQQFGELEYCAEPLAAYRWRAPGSMTTSMPKAVLDGFVDAFSETLAFGAATADVRAGAGRVFGQVLISALLTRRFVEIIRVARRFRAIPQLRAGRAWVIRHAVMAPFRAAMSLWSRRRGVYFPGG
jgi:hypothetical protein